MNDAPEPQAFVDIQMYEYTKGIVQSGPFAGTWLSPKQAWEGALSPMLLGTHEQELHNDIEKEIIRLSKMTRPTVINVGCSEGYYAIGLARRLPNADVFAIDINDTALEIAKTAAAHNGVNVTFAVPISLTDDEWLKIFDAPDLVVMDCESVEKQYLDLELFPGLIKSTIIVEIHNFAHQEERADEVITNRFSKSHTIDTIYEGPRNPNQFEFLLSTPSSFRWACVCENRPCLMHYFVMRPVRPNRQRRNKVT